MARDLCDSYVAPPLHPLSPLFHDPLPPYPHPYTRASSTLSDMVRLYARSCWLSTNVLLASRFGDRSVLCRYGCTTLEDLTTSSSSTVQPFRTCVTNIPGRSSWVHPTPSVGPPYLIPSGPTSIALSSIFSKTMLLDLWVHHSSTWCFYLRFYPTTVHTPPYLQTLVVFSLAWHILATLLPFGWLPTFGVW